MNTLTVLPATLPASIPSPSEGEWFLGPIPIRAYAFAIMLGILVAIWLGNKRWLARGGKPEVVVDVAFVAVLFGIVGARIYHVLTDWGSYFGTGRDPVDALRIWEGGLSIWGAVAFGVLGGWIVARYKGIPMPALADALAPGIILAQAIGRWGNYFNQELYGRPTDLPWAVEIDAAHRPAGDAYATVSTYHPTFLYESLWALLVFGILIWADRRFQMGHGRVFALYVALYSLGRAFIEMLRIDTGGDVLGPAREIMGLRINVWVAVLMLVGALVYLMVSAQFRPGREAPETLVGHAGPDDEDGEPAAGSGDAARDDASNGDAAAPDGADADADVGADAETDAEADSHANADARADGQTDARADEDLDADAGATSNDRTSGDAADGSDDAGTGTAGDDDAAESEVADSRGGSGDDEPADEAMEAKDR